MKSFQDNKTQLSDDEAFEQIQTRYRSWKKRRRRIKAFSFLAAALIIAFIGGVIANTRRDYSLSFQNERLFVVIPKISKMYGVKILVDDQQLLDQRFSGAFQESTPQSILDTIAESLDITCIKTDNTYHLKRKGRYP